MAVVAVVAPRVAVVWSVVGAGVGEPVGGVEARAVEVRHRPVAGESVVVGVGVGVAEPVGAGSRPDHRRRSRHQT